MANIFEYKVIPIYMCFFTISSGRLVDVTWKQTLSLFGKIFNKFFFCFQEKIKTVYG